MVFGWEQVWGLMVLGRGDLAQLCRVDIGLRADIIGIVEGVGLLKTVVHILGLIHVVVCIVRIEGLAAKLVLGVEVLLVVVGVIEVGVGGVRL